MVHDLQGLQHGVQLHSTIWRSRLFDCCISVEVSQPYRLFWSSAYVAEDSALVGIYQVEGQTSVDSKSLHLGKSMTELYSSIYWLLLCLTILSCIASKRRTTAVACQEQISWCSALHMQPFPYPYDDGLKTAKVGRALHTCNLLADWLASILKWGWSLHEITRFTKLVSNLVSKWLLRGVYRAYLFGWMEIRDRTTFEENLHGWWVLNFGVHYQRHGILASWADGRFLLSSTWWVVSRIWKLVLNCIETSLLRW